MLLLKCNHCQGHEPEVWSAHAVIDADAAEVLQALTDPKLIAAWAPVSFDVEDPAACLHAGCHERVSGSLAGLRASFDVHVARADLARLELVAEGPVCLDVAYRFRQQNRRVLIDARVCVRRRGGVGGQVMRAAVGALLSAGALDRALARLAEAVCENSQPELAAA
jgi:hypothetical protein